jgi:ssDNA-binding Zn-finger/Zn-ribbon topoisomerase 1
MMVRMKRKPAAPFVPAVLPEPCPKCGGQVWLRQWEGKCRARCEGAGCLFGFDTDKRGKAAARCPACGTGRLKTTPKGRVCADCGQWDNTPGAPGDAAQGVCPKCKTGRLAVRKGEYGHFVGCSDLVCGLTYTCDEAGRPEGGHCRVCKGPVRKTRAGSLICVVCSTWQNPKPVALPAAAVPRPPEAVCPVCRQALRVVWTRKQRWVYRCDACAKWLEAPRTSGGGGTP